METDELKREFARVTAPPGAALAGSVTDPTDPAAAAADLIGRLQAREARERQSLRRARLLYSIAAGAMLLAFGAALRASGPTGSLPRVVHLASLAAVFSFVAVAASARARRLARLDYGQAAHQFLLAAEARYAFLRWRDILVSTIGLSALGLTSGLYVVEEMLPRLLPGAGRAAGVAGFLVFYLLLCALGFHFTRARWQRDRLPLLQEISQARAALERMEAPEGPAADDR